MKTINKEIADIMELDNFYTSMVCQASEWLDEKAQGLTGDEEGIKHTYLDRVDCARALIIANDKLHEQAQIYNKLWAHSSELQAQLAERDSWIPISEAPRDGRKLLMYNSEYGGQQFVDWVAFDGTLGKHVDVHNVTHFQYLPEPPKTNQQ